MHSALEYLREGEKKTREANLRALAGLVATAVNLVASRLADGCRDGEKRRNIQH